MEPLHCTSARGDLVSALGALQTEREVLWSLRRGYAHATESQGVPLSTSSTSYYPPFTSCPARKSPPLCRRSPRWQSSLIPWDLIHWHPQASVEVNLRMNREIGHEFRLPNRSSFKAYVAGTSQYPEAGVQQFWCRPRCLAPSCQTYSMAAIRKISSYFLYPLSIIS